MKGRIFGFKIFEYSSKREFIQVCFAIAYTVGISCYVINNIRKMQNEEKQLIIKRKEYLKNQEKEFQDVRNQYIADKTSKNN